MMYHAWMRPGKKQSRVRVMLIIESAVQNPALTQTADAGVWLAFDTSVGVLVCGFCLTCDRWEEDGEDR